MKKCGTCKITKKNKDFSWRKKSKGLRQSICILCRRKYDKSRYANKDNKEKERLKARNRRAYERNMIFLFNYLKRNPCVDCNESDPVILTFDHVKGKKIKEVGALATSRVSIETLKKEIAKCEVRCVSCHTKKTAKERNYYAYIKP